MLPRSLIIFRNIHRISESEFKNIIHEFNIINRNISQFSNRNKIIKYSDLYSKNYSKEIKNNEKIISPSLNDESKKSEVKLENITEKSLEVENKKKSWANILTSKKHSDVNLDNVQEKSLEVDIKEKKKLDEHIISIKDTIKESLNEINLIKEKLDKNSQIDVEIVKKPLKKRKPVDLSAISLDRNFITPNRAMDDFALKQSDLESLPRTLRRSPFEMEPQITVYWRKDVEKKALEIYGSKENLQKKLMELDIQKRKHQQKIFTIKRRLKDYRRELDDESDKLQQTEGLFGRSGRVVITAVAINGFNFLFKLVAWIFTGSHSMFSETIHSLADTINQLILAYGIHKSIQDPNPDHPYGYGNMKYVASLISGVGIFCVGTGLSFYHGVMGLIDPQPVEDFYWAYFILAGALVSEGATWLVAFNSIRKGARERNMPVKEYVFRGQDPSVNVVLMEDLAAVTGVILAGGCMGISSLTGSPVPDAIGSFLVGAILGVVASFIIYTNVAALVGRSIPRENLEKINQELELDVMIRAIHDVKGIDMGNYLVRYKAEVDFDGRELTRAYLDKQDLNELLEQIKKIDNIDDLESFMLKNGENIVDLLGGEIDRIELKLKKKHPEIRHCDLEIL